MSIAIAVLSVALVAGGVVWVGTTRAGGTVSQLSTQTVTVVIRAAKPTWTDTGVALQAHQTLKITATGTVSNGLFLISPRGRPVANWDCTHFNGYRFIGPELRCWSLIGKIGNGNPFQVGTLLNVGDSAPGELFLMMNDGEGTFSDNMGRWTVAITTPS